MNKSPYEVIVIGSGATGGIAALTFAKAGVRVLIIEAGPDLTAQKAFGSEPLNTLKRINGLVSGEKSNQAQHPGYWKANPDLYSNEKNHPYTYPPNKPYLWSQGHQVGGRSLTWGGITLRLSDSEFKASEKDGFGPKWPIGYKELEPHYSFLEKLLVVHGNKDKLTFLPDGNYIDPLPFTKSEEQIAKRISSEFGYKLIHSRGFSSSKPLSPNTWPRSSSPGSSLKLALETGKVEIISNHMVERFTLSPDKANAKGVVVVNQLNGERCEIKANLIVLCSSTIQSIRILLNSEEKNSDNGFVDPSGSLGCFLMDHISTCRFFSLPYEEKFSPSNETLSGAGSFLIPFDPKTKSATNKPFLRNYGIWGGVDRFEPPRFLKRKPHSAIGFLIAHGEVLPSKANKVSLSNKQDKWGMNVPHIDCKWNENEKTMFNDMQNTISEIVSVSGGDILPLKDLIKMPFIEPFISKAIALQDSAPPPGYYIHEVGGAPMGSNENSSVVDKWNRLWRCQNVLVVDGACWPTSGWQSPTLTMMSICRRACLNAIRPLDE